VNANNMTVLRECNYGETTSFLHVLVFCLFLLQIPNSFLSSIHLEKWVSTQLV